MVTSKNNFRAMLRRKYPTAKVETVFGYPIYLLSEPLNEYDQRDYYSCKLADNKYFVTLEQDADEAAKLLDLYNSGLLNNRLSQTGLRDHTTLPTSYNAFEQWLIRHQIVGVEKQHKQGTAPVLLGKENVLNPDNINWMMYEINDPDKLFTERLCSSVPHVRWPEDPNKIYILVKTSRSVYKSIKDQKLQRPARTLTNYIKDEFDNE